MSAKDDLVNYVRGRVAPFEMAFPFAFVAEKIECDRCGAQAEGRIVKLAEKPGALNVDVVSGATPSVKDWSFVRAPRIEGKTWPSNATLICPACALALVEFLKPLPRIENKHR